MNRFRASLSFRLSLFVALLTGLSGAAFAQTYATWISTSNTTFDYGANWDIGVPPADDVNSNVFGVSVDGADMVLTASRSIAGLTFAGSQTGRTLSSTNGAVLTLGPSGLSLGVYTVYVSASLGGAGGVVLGGGGNSVIATLSGNNTYTGGTTVANGTMHVASANALGTGPLTLTAGGFVNDTGSTLTLASNPALTFASTSTFSFSGAHDINLGTGSVTIAAGKIFNIAAGLTVTLGGNITSAPSINLLNGSGTLALTGTSTFDGTVNTGRGGATVSFNSIADLGVASALGAPSTVAKGTIALTSGTLRYTGAAAATNRVVNLAGSGSIDGSGTGAVSFTSDFTATAASSKTLTLTGTTLGNTIGGAIVNNSSTNKTSVAKTGTGSWILGGTNTYTGTTTVTAGTLLVNGSTAAGSAVTVSGTGTLGGTGNILGTATIASGGTLAPGNSPGLLSFGSDLTLASGSHANFQIDGTVRGTSYDAVNVAGLTTTGGTFNLVFGPTLATGTALTLFAGANGAALGSTAGGFDFVTGSGSYSGNFVDQSGVWTLLSGAQTLTFTESTGTLLVTAVPEPATCAALLGAAALGLAAMRRRKAV